MRKSVFYDKNALEEFEGLNLEVQKDFQARIAILDAEGKLEFPEARKVTKDLFEIRVTREGSYRGFYAYVKREAALFSEEDPKDASAKYQDRTTKVKEI